jgi:hypothetical protein
MRFSSKEELLAAIEDEHRRFLAVADRIPRRLYRAKGVWGDGWTIQDLFAHLSEWEQMFLGWYRLGRDGGDPILPAAGYTWRQTPALNEAIWRKHGSRPLTEVLKEFDRSYAEILSLVNALSVEDLFTPGRFAWTRDHPLTTYLVPNTSSHYRTAAKILKRWLKNCAR